jgi:2-C-methyl-D-erythritol 4-phosphate cytidylyltransferase
VNKQLGSNLLILSPQVISRSSGGSYNWVRQTPQSFETTVLDIHQMTCKPRGGSHDWVWQTPQSFEITVLEYSLSTGYKLNFRQV